MAISTRLAMRCVFACICTRTHAHVRAREYRREWESYEIRTLRIDTARLLCIHAPTPTSCARAIYDKCVRRANATCVNIEDLVAFANDAGTMYRTQFSIVLYIRYIGTVRLLTPARKWYRMPVLFS